MTIDHDDKKIIIIKRKIMNILKRTNEKIDNVKKLSCRDDVKFKFFFKNVFDLRFRSLDSQFISTNIITINSVDDLVMNFVYLTSLIIFSSTKNKISIKNSIIKDLKRKTSLKFKCFKDDKFFD